MMQDRLQQELRNYFEAEVRQVEPPRDILAGVIARLGDRDSLQQRFRIVLWNRWLRRSLLAIPAVAAVVALLILHPWATIPAFTDVMARAYSASQTLQSYRIEETLTQPSASGNVTIVLELAYSAPDRYYTKKTQGGEVDETIRIGTELYYRTLQDGVPPNIVVPESSGLAPDMGKTFSLLNSLHDLESLGTEKVDGVDTYHYRGNLYVTSIRKFPVEVWVGKEDSLPRKEITEGYVTKFLDFNEPIRIDAPLTPTGDLKDGWHILKKPAHLNSNILSGIGGSDIAHSLIKYDISLSNDGLDDARNVQVTVETMATNDSVKPAHLEASPTNSGVPVNISSGQSVRFHVEWQFDGGTMSKMELAGLMDQTVISVTYRTPDGTPVTQTFPQR